MEFCSTKILKGKGAPKKTKWPKKFSMHRCQLSQQHVITFLATCTSLLHKLDSCISLQKKMAKKTFSLPWIFFYFNWDLPPSFGRLDWELGSHGVLRHWQTFRFDIPGIDFCLSVPPGCGPAVPDASHLKPGGVKKNTGSWIQICMYAYIYMCIRVKMFKYIHLSYKYILIHPTLYTDFFY